MNKYECYKALIEVAARSPANKRKVGAIVIGYNLGIEGAEIIASGYNYNLAEGPCEDEQGNTKDTVIHAEVACIKEYNQLFPIERDSFDKHLMLITHEPCSGCKAAILSIGLDYEVLKKEPIVCGVLSKEDKKVFENMKLGKVEVRDYIETKDGITWTLKQRGSIYGTFQGNATITQSLMRVLLDNKQRELQDFELEALHMIMHKASRIVNGQRLKKDNWHDIAGYAKLAEDLTIDN